MTYRNCAVCCEPIDPERSRIGLCQACGASYDAQILRDTSVYALIRWAADRAIQTRLLPPESKELP